MKLRVRLVLAMVACSVLPLGGAALLARPFLLRFAERSVNGPEALQRAVFEIDVVLLLAAVFAAAVAVIVGLLLGPTLERPINEVVRAADRIALGTRSVQIDARAGGEAGRLVKAFNNMARQLDAASQRLRRVERVAAWRDIARQMAHEIKNPLTPIQMAVEMLRKARERNLPDFDALFDEETRIILEEVARLRRLVENFSRFARAPRPRLELVHVADLVSHAVGLHAGGAVEVTGEADADLPDVRADREQMTQVLVNLVANACFAAEDRARKNPRQGPAAVHVSARRAGTGKVSIAVDDNGAGIDASVIDRLFEPYVTTKLGQGGTGLGLAVVYRIVTDHGGTVTPESSPEGTRFEVVLKVEGPGPNDVTFDTLEKS